MITFPSRAFLMTGFVGVSIALSACGQEATKDTKTAEATPKVEEAAPVEKRELASYVGEYPSNNTKPEAGADNKTATNEAPTNGSFMKDPAVQAALFKITLPGSVRATIEAPSTEVPIFKAGNMVVAHGCEPKNCGAKNWTVAVSEDGSKAMACSFEAKDGEKGGVAYWYGGSEPVGKRAEGCPQDAGQYSASQAA